MTKLIYILYLLKFIIIKNELISVIEINRHGARTPKYFPNETSKLFFGTKDMQLTINGYRQEQILGEFVKSKYINKFHFLKNHFDLKEFKMISSPTQRTIFSAAGFLSGIYPDYIVKMKYDDDEGMTVDDTIPIADNFLKIKEIPIRVIDKKKDSLFHAHSCHLNGKSINDHLRELNYDEIFHITDEDKMTAIKSLKPFLGLNKLEELDPEKEIKELSKYFSVYYYHFEKKLKNSLKKKSIDTIKKYCLNNWYSYRIKDNKYLRICASNFFNTILQNFKTSINANNKNESYIKYTVYSGHDTIIVNIFSNLLKNDNLRDLVIKSINDASSYKFLIPPFASNIFFELHKDNVTKKYFVHIIYNGKYISKGIKELIDDKIIENRIDYDDFDEILSNLIDNDYKKLDCSKNDKE